MRSSIIKTVLFCLVSIFPMTAQVTGLAGWDIYLDPGHSRMENMGIYNYSEAQKVLRVGLELRDLLLTKTDIDTVWNSRYDDNVLVSLSQRTDEANALGASWYHSIHSDAGSPQYNSTLLLWGQYQNGSEKIPNGGKAMSDIMVNILTDGMRIGTRGSIGDCSFYGCTFTGPYLSVNRRSTMPSELSEAGFHTSPVQNPRNMNAEWKRLEAYTFFWTILDYHSLPRPDIGIVTGFVYDVEKDIPLNGATIEVAGQSYTTDTFASLFSQYTNDPDLLQNGFYFIEDVPTDTTLEVIVSAPGYYSDTLMATINNNFFTFVDANLVSSAPPTITSTTPDSNAVDVSVFSTIEINFSRRMETAAVDTSIDISPGISYSSSWQNSNRRLVLTPDSLENSTNYQVTLLPQATDIFGHLLDGNGDGIEGDPYTFSFTTVAPDTLPPLVQGAYPPQNASAVELRPIINFEFDEIIAAASIAGDAIQLERNSDGLLFSGVTEHYEVGRRSVLSFFSDQRLTSESQFTARINAGLEDVFGNAIAAVQDYTFTTGNLIDVITIIDTFDSNLLNNWWDPQQSGTTTGIISTQTSRKNNSSITNLNTGSTRSMQLSYGWDLNASAWMIREYLGSGAPRNVNFDDSYILQMYVFGDGSGNRIRFALDDNVPAGGASDHEVSQWFTIDWTGWRLISWDLANDPVGSWTGNGVLNGTLRFDSIQLTYTSGAATSGNLYFDDLRLVKKQVTAIGDEQPLAVPTAYRLEQNYPNPFNPETTIRFTVANQRQPVQLIVYDMLGRTVRTLIDEDRSAGEHEVRWNGRSDRGEKVSSGTYLYRISIGEFQRTEKMVLLK